MAKKPALHPASGDVELKLGTTTLLLKPTLQAGLSVSRQAGGIRGAIDKIMTMDLDAICGVIRIGIGPAEAKRYKDLERMVYETGLTDADGEVLTRCIEFLTNLARGGRPAPEDGEVTSAEDPTNPETQS